MGAFDDLIPQSEKRTQTSGTFADLIPQRAPEGPEYPEAERQAAQRAGVASGFGSSVVRGIPLVGGLAEKGAAAINAGIGGLAGDPGDFGTRYTRELEAARNAKAEWGRQHPALNTAGNIGGSVIGVNTLVGGMPQGPRYAPGMTVFPPRGPPVQMPQTPVQPLEAAPLSQGVPGAARALGIAPGRGRLALGVGSGGAIGATDAALNDEDAAAGGVIGAAGGALAPVVGRVAGAVANRMPAGPGMVPGRAGMGPSQPSVAARSVAPTEQQLRQTADTQFQGARDTHFMAPGHEIGGMGARLEQDLLHGQNGARSFDPSQAPETFAVLHGMKTSGPLDPNGLLALRERLSNVAMKGDPREALASSHALRELDVYLSSQPSAFSDLYAAGRAPQGAAKRSERFSQDVLENAGRRAAATHAGENLGNTTRQRLDAVIKSNQRGSELGRGLNDEEIAAMDREARGNGFTNSMRKVHSLTSGLRTGTIAAGIGGAVGSHFGPWGAAIGAATPRAVGEVARHAAENSTVRGARTIDENLRLRSPLGAAARQARNEGVFNNERAQELSARAAKFAQTPITEAMHRILSGE